MAYSVVTIAGALVYGSDTWFRAVDPIARVFRYYGHVAPLDTDAKGRLVVRLPGTKLADSTLLDGIDEVAFVIALLWATTFDGVVTTPLWRSLAIEVVGAGVPPALVYPGALGLGFAVFLGLYLGATRLVRRTADTFIGADELARRFAPPLLAIAAGYHVAHFLGYFLSLSPQLVTTVSTPFTAVEPQVLVLPDWFGVVGIAAILLGHLLAIWAAHAAALSLFPSRLQAIRSQYPFVGVMICYTMTSLWIVTRPDTTPPFLL